MIRRLVVSDAAREEFESVRASLFARSSRSAREFVVASATAFESIEEFPFAKVVRGVRATMEIRRAKIGRWPYAFFYFVYPSVDFNTGEALDVIHVLACLHERQAEPNWQSRDPFRLP